MMNDSNTSWELTSNNLYNYSKSFPTTGHQVKYLLPVLYSLIFVVGFIGNALVVWVITMGIQLKSMADVCLLNLALADLFLVLSLPFQAYQMNHSWFFGKPVCTLIRGIYYVGFYGGIFFILLTTIDRYLAIVHSVFALRVRKKASGTVASLGVWIIAVAASFPELLNIRVKKLTKKPTNFFCTAYFNNNVFPIVLFKRSILGLFVLSIIAFCYSMILWKLHRSPSPKKHSMRLIVLVMVVFFCCWVPYNIAEFTRGMQLMKVIPRKPFLKTLDIFRAVAFSHSCLNPFIYVFVGEKFRKHLIRLVRERWPICY